MSLLVLILMPPGVAFLKAGRLAHGQTDAGICGRKEGALRRRGRDSTVPASSGNHHISPQGPDAGLTHRPPAKLNKSVTVGAVYFKAQAPYSWLKVRAPTPTIGPPYLARLAYPPYDLSRHRQSPDHARPCQEAGPMMAVDGALSGPRGRQPCRNTSDWYESWPVATVASEASEGAG